jgi:S1-C subfamily serine protease
VNLVDLAIVGVLGLAAVHGVTQGAALQVLSFGGFWIGLLLGAAIAPWTQRLVDSPFASAFVSLITFLGLALIGGAVGRYFGTHAWAAIRRLKLGKADAALGAVVSVIAALMAVWLIALLLAAGPTQEVAQAVHRSAIVRTLMNRLPPAPSVFAQLQQFISSTPFPRVFEGLEPVPAGPVDVPGNAVVQGAVASAGQSTVRVVGLGCGGVQTGSGFVVQPGNLVVTNAHVVAGINAPQVEDSNGTHRSVPVLFDPEIDLAVLRTSGLSGGPLPVFDGDADRGQGGAVLGYPGGGRFDATPAAVLRRFFATGRDIYNQSTTRREVYQLQAQIRQGNSGGPFVRQDGTVLGVVFAASTTQSDVGYALTSSEVAPRVQQAQASGAVNTGACAA